MRIGIIGGSGFPSWADWPGLESTPGATADATDYGPPSAPLAWARASATGHELVYLARHDQPPRLLPHEINYRANLAALAQAKVDLIIASHTVGGIDRRLADGGLVLPDQLIDYTWGRQHTYGGEGDMRHVRFDTPFHPGLRGALGAAADRAGIAAWRYGVYGCTQGPRFETPAEIERMARDGCTLVGMTAMPEAALAAELELPYASVAIVVNAAAGRGRFDMASIEAAAASGMALLQRLVLEFLQAPELLVERRG